MLGKLLSKPMSKSALCDQTSDNVLGSQVNLDPLRSLSKARDGRPWTPGAPSHLAVQTSLRRAHKARLIRGTRRQLGISDGAVLDPKRLRAGFLHVGEESESLARGEGGKKGKHQQQEGEGKASLYVCCQHNNSLTGQTHLADDLVRSLFFPIG